MKKSDPLEYYNMEITQSAKKFKSVRKEAGAELKINSYLISKNIWEANQKFEKGADAPTIDQIRTAFDSTDSAKFLAGLKKLAEERRSAETPEELKAAEGDDTQIFFGTGYFEVAADNFDTGDKDVRYFLPLKDVQDGNVNLDLKKAKVEVLRGVTIYLLKDLGDKLFFIEDGLGPVKEKLSSLQQKVRSGCFLTNCHLSDNEKIGTLSFEMMRLFNLQYDDFFTEPAEDNLLIARKQLCLLHLLFQVCRSEKEIAETENLLKDQKIDCTDEMILKK